MLLIIIIIIILIDTCAGIFFCSVLFAFYLHRNNRLLFPCATSKKKSGYVWKMTQMNIYIYIWVCHDTKMCVLEFRFFFLAERNFCILDKDTRVSALLTYSSPFEDMYWLNICNFLWSTIACIWNIQWSFIEIETNFLVKMFFLRIKRICLACVTPASIIKCFQALPVYLSIWKRCGFYCI